MLFNLTILLFLSGTASLCDKQPLVVTGNSSLVCWSGILGYNYEHACKTSSKATA